MTFRASKSDHKRLGRRVSIGKGRGREVKYNGVLKIILDQISA